jgi:hypothetical protein
VEILPEDPKPPEDGDPACAASAGMHEITMHRATATTSQQSSPFILTQNSKAWDKNNLVPEATGSAR